MSVNVQVSTSLKIFESLTYGYHGDPSALKVGTRVMVPVGSRLTHGWIVGTESQYKGRVKNIVGVIECKYVPEQRTMDFVSAVSRLYFTSMGTLLDASLSPKLKSSANLYFENEGKPVKMKNVSLTQLQALAKKEPIEFYIKTGTMPEMTETLEPQAPRGSVSPKNTFLLSFERIEEYRTMIAENLEGGQSVLITVPDNLTASYIKERLENLGVAVDLYNSEIKPKDREVLWHDYVFGRKTGVVVGGQSAVFLPVANLGLIISERAGSSLYKQSYFSPYNINVLARLRAECYKIPLVEGFSTFSVQAYQNFRHSKISVSDKREENQRPPVDIQIIKRGTKGIPEEFVERLKYYTTENKKILVVLNRKESVNFLLCDKCKKMTRCPRCDGFIDVDDHSAVTCRRCGFEKTTLTECHVCGEPLVPVENISIASVKKLVKNRVIETGITTISSEGLKEDHLLSVLKRVGDSKIVIATPVVVNPVFYGSFDAVVYIRPESWFNLEEYDAAEKVYSMVAELREMVKEGGAVDVFSTFHFHYSLKLINDEEGFFERELKYREWFHLPPYSSVYRIEVRGKDLRKLAKEMRGINKKFKESLNIKRVYLASRTVYRGIYKGVLEAHAQPEAIIETGLLKKRDVAVELILV
jgi:primosomal protein N'